MIGGIADNGSPSSRITESIREVNTTENSVREVATLRYGRTKHACEFLQDGRILISGGYSNTEEPSASIVNDEIYDLLAGTTKEISASIKRYNHRLLLLEDTVYALGGQEANRTEISSVKKFNMPTNSWLSHTEALKSQATVDLAVTAFPQSAVDCSDGCKCGVQRLERIVNGDETKVINDYLL